jgi:hypothetical protein
MRQINNTECGPIILCERCFTALNHHSIEAGYGCIIAEDVTDLVPVGQLCDACGPAPVRV